MSRLRVFVAGATGTIGQAAVRALVGRGHEVVCLVRPAGGQGQGKGQGRTGSGSPAAPGGVIGPDQLRALQALLPGALLRAGDVQDPASIERDGFCGERFDAVVSCLASRTGSPRDAWAIDHQAHLHLLEAARAAGVRHFVLLSALCVQKPLLAFQQAKLAFERALMASGLTWSIVRPTAFFKSLSGQVDRLRRGKPFLLFGDGALTACKPISDDDLGDFLAGCLDDPDRHDRILPIGGPGEAITPRQQGLLLFEALGVPPKFKRVPVGLLDVIIGVLSALGRLVPTLADKAELARIGRYYATESMLVLDPASGRYDPQATPSHGQDTLASHYQRLARGQAADQRGDHAVF